MFGSSTIHPLIESVSGRTPSDAIYPNRTERITTVQRETVAVPRWGYESWK